MTYLPWPWHSWQRLPARPLHSGQVTMMPLPGGVTVAVMITSLGAGYLAACTMALSGFSLSLGSAFEYCVGGRDGRRPGWAGRPHAGQRRPAPRRIDRRAPRLL